MKKYYLFTILLVSGFLCSNQLIAQTEKGNILLGGGATFNFTDSNFDSGNGTSDVSTTTSFNFSPSGGYFIADRLAVGASIGLFFSSFEVDGGDITSNSNGISFGPFVRYYTESGIFASANLGFGSTNIKQEGTFANADFTSSSFSWGLGAGYAIFLNESISLEPTISYNRISTDPNTEVGEERNINGSLNFGVGFNIYFKK